jgi:hypothetical protein
MELTVSVSTVMLCVVPSAPVFAFGAVLTPGLTNPALALFAASRIDALTESFSLPSE